MAGIVEEPFSHLLLYQNDATTPLGRLGLGGLVTNGRGVTPVRPLRVYGSYAVMCLLRGKGRYQDNISGRLALAAGDVVLVFPELPHWYGPRRKQPGWDEFYVTFDGALFELWREAGLLNVSCPVLRPGESWTAQWAAQVQRLLEERPVSARERARQVTDFASLLGNLLRTSEDAEITPGHNDASPGPAASAAWIGSARQLLETDLGRELPLEEVAASVSLSYETFRKRFRELTGTTPAHYRAARRMEAAKALLRYTPGITNREIAQTLGFSDEFHFSRRFTRIAGITPREFRKRLAENTARSPG